MQKKLSHILDLRKCRRADPFRMKLRIERKLQRIIIATGRLEYVTYELWVLWFEER